MRTKFSMPFTPLLIALAVAATLLPLRIAAAQQAGTAPAASLRAASIEDRRKTLDAIFKEAWEDNLRREPEFASSIGDKRYNDQLKDYSVRTYNEQLARGRDYLMRLGQIDDSGLSDQEQLSKDLMVRDLIQEQEEARFKPWEFPVTQLAGPYTELPQLSSQLSFKTVKDYDDWTARLNQVPRVFEQITNNMSTGIDDKRVMPKYLMEKVLVQVNALAAMKPDESPFAEPLKHFPSTVSSAEQQRIRAETLDAIAKHVLPAYKIFSRFLSGQYIPAGRIDAGIWALPDGDAYYKFLIHQSTTTNLTADQIHLLGMDWVKRDEAEMLGIALKLGFKDLKSFQTAVTADPKLKAVSGDALVAAYRGYIDQMKPKLPQLFGRLPKAALVIEEMPSYIAKDQTAAFYQHGTPDGSIPGKVEVNTYNATTRTTNNIESIAYHEGVPGHHLQIAISQELEGLPEFRKYEYYTAYTEGWGLYSERLGRDVGFYQNPYSDYGRLEADIWRAIRLVVDTGVHSKHWTRDQMVQFFHDHSAIEDTNINAEVDRYVAWPAQALGYKVGQLKLLELRDRARQTLGDKFDIRSFHDQLLDSGALPLDILEQRVDAWIARQKPSR
jgi:uncharacterized protein (DUF885 family)